MPKNLILASSSTYRKTLLSRLMLPFETISPDVDESRLPDESPKQHVLRLALLKAKTVAETSPYSIIIASDQVALHGGKVVGKPYDHQTAVAQLQAVSGKSIEHLTSLCVYDSDTGEHKTQVIPYTVHFKSLSLETIEAYLHKEKPYDCAGSIKSESLGIALFSKMEGDDPTALIGLPLIALTNMLKDFGIRVLP